MPEMPPPHPVRDPLSDQTYEVFRPKVRLLTYWLEGAFLIAAGVVPVLSWFIWHNGQMLARSGSLTVVCAAVAEFVMLNRMNVKHLLNACRARAHERPWDVSRAATAVGILSLVLALLGTFIWGYGDCLVAPNGCW